MRTGEKRGQGRRITVARVGLFQFGVALVLAVTVLSGCANVKARKNTVDTPGGQNVFDENERLLSTYFFSRGPWDDIEEGKYPWAFAYPGPEDEFAKVYGPDSPERWPGNEIPDTSAWPLKYKDGEAFPLWLMAEWRAMKWSGFDFVLQDVWDCLSFNKDGTPQQSFQDLLDAWVVLDNLGEAPLPIALELETPFECILQEKDGDATETSSDGIEELWLPVRYFLRQFYGEGEYAARAPLRALARVMVNGEPRPIIHFWFPTWVDAGLKKWNAWTFEELRRKCRETFGVGPFIGVNQHIYGPTCLGGWSSIQPSGDTVDISSAAGVVDYDIPWWGSMAGAQISSNAIVIGPGHWCMWQSGDVPAALRYSDDEYGEDKFRYLNNWRTVFSNPEHFERQILIVESWNNGGEGCAISYSTPQDIRSATGEFIDRWGDSPEQFMRWTRELAPFWKQGKIPRRFSAE